MRERRKRIDIIGLAIFVIAVLAISGMTYATTYDFSSGAGVNKWAYEGYDNNKSADTPPDYETALNSSEITAISASDGSLASYNIYTGPGGPSYYEFHRFKFKINEAVSEILKLYVMHEGYGHHGGAGGDGVHLYIWNYSGHWESIGYHTNGYDTTIEKNYIDEFSNYINTTGYLQLLAITYDQGTSCPFYYSYDGNEYVLDAEGLLFSPLPWWERSSIAMLENLEASNGTYKIKVTEELDETSYFDKLSLLVAEHSSNVKVYPDFYNNLHTIKNPIEPIMAVDSDGNDSMALLEKDNVYWLPMPDFDKLIDSDNDSIVDAYNESDFYKWLELEYPKPENATQAKLLCRLREDRFGTVGIWGGFLHTVGKNNLNLLRNVYANKTLNWVISQMMRIEVWNGSEWIEQHRIAEATASTKGNNLVILLNLTGINTNTLKIRFRSIVGVQGVDYAWIDYTEDEPIEVTEIIPNSLTGGDIEKILHDDEDYLTLEKGSIVYVEFPELPNPENRSRTYLIKDNGYYLHNYNNYVEYTDELDILLNQIFSDELYAARYFMPKFYSSYYEGHHTIYTNYVKVEVLNVYNQETGEYFSTIQDAIDDEDTQDGHTIIVGDGTYRENIIVNKSITLKAASSPVIDGMGGVGITVDVNDTVIQDMTITNCSLGIYVHNDSFTLQNVTLYNDTIDDTKDDCESGIHFKNVNRSAIIECFIYNISSDGDAYALYLENSDYNNVSDIEIGDVNGSCSAYGIRVYDSDHNNITSTSFGDINGSLSAYGIYLFDNADFNNVTVSSKIGNITSGGGTSSYGIHLDSSDYNNITTNGFGNISSLEGDAYAIRVSHSSHNNITSTTFGEINGNVTACGIRLHTGAEWNNITVSSQIGTITGIGGTSSYGIYLDTSSNHNNITTNEFGNISSLEGDAYAIRVHNSDHNNITSTTFGEIDGNVTACGIELHAAERNNITVNSQIGNVTSKGGTSSYGIYLDGSNHNNITTNEFGNISSLEGDAYGVYLHQSGNNTFDSIFIRGVNGSSKARGVHIETESNNNTFSSSISIYNVTGEEACGIYVDKPSYKNKFYNTIIKNITARNNSYGIWLDISENNTLTNTNISNVLSQNRTAYGIYTRNSDDNIFDPTIIENVTAVNGTAYGIYLSYSYTNSFDSTTVSTIKGNTSACSVHLSKSGGNVFNFTNISGVHANTEAYGMNISSGPLGSNNNEFNTGSITDINAPTWWSIYSCEYSKNNRFTLYTLSSYPTTVSFTYGNGMKMKSVDTPPPDPADRVNIGKYVNITNLTLTSWVNLTVHYEDSDVPHLAVEYILEIWKHNGSWYKDGWANWESLDIMSNVVSANITDFGSIFAPLQPLPPNIVDPKVAVDMNGPPLEQGDMICYTAWINNTGGMDSTNNTGNEFEDPIPSHTTYVPDSLTINDIPNDDNIADGIGYDSGNNMIIWNGIIPAHSSINISFCVTVDLDVPDGTVISNQGIVYYDSDGDGTNDAQKPTDDPSTIFKDDPTIIRIPSQVPALTPIGMLLLIGMITIGTIIILKKKRK